MRSISVSNYAFSFTFLVLNTIVISLILAIFASSNTMYQFLANFFINNFDIVLKLLISPCLIIDSYFFIIIINLN